MDAQKRHLVVDADIEGPRISGRIADDAGTTVPFEGWIELASLLERWPGAAAAEDDGDAGRQFP